MTRNTESRLSHALLSTTLFVLLGTTPALSGGLAILGTVVSDNGDADGFADSNETVTVRLNVRNTSGIALTGVTATVLGLSSDLVCVTQSSVNIGDLAPDESRLTAEGFTFRVLDIDRTLLGLGPFDPLAATFSIAIDSGPVDQPAQPDRLTFDLDLDVTEGSGATSFFESFESQTLGAFEIENLDAGRSSLAASDGYRCQYNDPDWAGGNSFGNTQCFMGNSPAHADLVFWGLSGPNFSPGGGRGFSGFHSLFFGRDLGFPENWTTPLSFLEAVRTTEPIYLAWDVSPELSFKHMVSLVDSRAANLAEGTAYDRAVVMAQFADDQGQPVGPWVKIYPFQNVYDQRNAPGIINCAFDPIDDGNTEDDFYDPSDPNREFGPSSTCWPELTFVNLGETSNAYALENVGLADGPGLQGLWGIGTWIESRFDLSRFRGRPMRLRFLSTTIEAGGTNVEDWQDLFQFNPDPGDDGWWIDDVTVSGTLLDPATVAVDSMDNSSLPGPTGDADSDGVFNVCDNCDLANPDQRDLDLDGTGDLCDPCPTDATDADTDADTICDVNDNCLFVVNPAQTDADSDDFGVPCDCDDANDTIFPGANEISDGLDNQCPGDFGYGVADEIPPTSGFFDPGQPGRFAWFGLNGATSYQVARSFSPDFSECTLWVTGLQFLIDNEIPSPGKRFYYLPRALAPFPGSWGQDSTPQERTMSCVE